MTNSRHDHSKRPSRIRPHLLLPALLLGGISACDSFLNLEPVDRIPAEGAVVDAAGARAALVGAYSALRSTGYYGGTFVFFGDLPADNARHTGTLQTYGDAARNEIRADNGAVQTIWSVAYNGIGRANLVLEQVPDVVGLSQTERNQILGEAYFLRALHHHNLVKLFGDVPLITETISSPGQASQVQRASTEEVYAQIIADLQQAATLMTDTTQTRRASVGAVRALQARVHLYRGDWAAAEAAANAVLGMTSGGSQRYRLVDNFSALFSPTGAQTSEDIFRIAFSAADYNNIGFYYHSGRLGGRFEVAPDPSLIAAYSPGDARGAWTIKYDDATPPTPYGAKFPTTAGAEHVHVIRLAEVILIKAEALARQNRLPEAVTEYNRIRERAGLLPHVFGVDVTTQEQVLDEIFRQRRLELAFEGDRWSDLVRTGRAVATLGLDAAYKTLFPIPQRERDVAPNLTQNPGY